MHSSFFWGKIHDLSSSPDWNTLEKYYRTRPIDINYYNPIYSEKLTILHLTCLHKKFDFARKMIKSHGHPDYSLFPESGELKGRTILMTAILAKQSDLVEKILTSSQAVGLNQHYLGINPYNTLAIFGAWGYFKIIHSKYPDNLPIDQSPDIEKFKGQTPLWLACKKEEYSSILDMLAVTPNANISNAPLNQKSPLELILLSDPQTQNRQKERQRVIELFIFLGSTNNEPASVIIKNKMIQILNEVQEKKFPSDEGLIYLFKNYPQLTVIPIDILQNKIHALIGLPKKDVNL